MTALKSTIRLQWTKLPNIPTVVGTSPVFSTTKGITYFSKGRPIVLNKEHTAWEQLPRPANLPSTISAGFALNPEQLVLIGRKGPALLSKLRSDALFLYNVESNTAEHVDVGASPMPLTTLACARNPLDDHLWAFGEGYQEDSLNLPMAVAHLDLRVRPRPPFLKIDTRKDPLAPKERRDLVALSDPKRQCVWIVQGSKSRSEMVVHRFDLKSRSFQKVSTFLQADGYSDEADLIPGGPASRGQFTAALLPDIHGHDKIVVFGGTRLGLVQDLMKDPEVLDVETLRWQAAVPSKKGVEAPPPRRITATTNIGHGAIAMIGGQTTFGHLKDAYTMKVLS